MRGRRLAGWLLTLLLADLALLVITGDVTLLRVLGAPSVGAAGFLARSGVAALVFCVRFWPRPAGGHGLGLLVLGALFFPSLAHFQMSGQRLSGDATSYYAFVHSIWKDGDSELADDYDRFGLLGRGDLAAPTTTGQRRSIDSVGPAVAWAPFYAVGEVVGRTAAWIGARPDLSRFGPYHRNAVALGSFLYGYLALFLIFVLARRFFEEGPALAAVLLIFGATFHYWYMVLEPGYAHATSTFFAAAALVLWERGRAQLRPAAFLTLGLVLGLAVCVRWHNGVFLMLPGAWLALRFFRGHDAKPHLLACAGLLLAGILIGASPQMFAWKASYGSWIFPNLPQEPGFVRLHGPRGLATLFTSRHGLLSWTPIFWLGFLGFAPLLLRRPRIAWPLLPPFLTLCWVNVSVADYWGGPAFSGRRFDSLLPVFALAMAASIEVARRLLRAHPRAALAVVGLALATWNLSLSEAVRRQLIPRDDTVAFSDLAAANARALSESVGFPTTWPASWLFALRYDRSPAQFDLLVGRYLFHTQNDLSGVIDLGAPGDEALLGEGFAGAERQDDRDWRRLRGRARLFATLHHAEDLELVFEISAPGPDAVEVRVNGRPAGTVRVGSQWLEARLPVAESYWRREINEVLLEARGEGVRLDRVRFERYPGSRRWA